MKELENLLVVLSITIQQMEDRLHELLSNPKMKDGNERG